MVFIGFFYGFCGKLTNLRVFWINFVGLWEVGKGFPHWFKGINLGGLLQVVININRTQIV